MTDYQKMYTMLFNAITDALMQMEKQNYGSAKETLISAQQRAEELYLLWEFRHAPVRKLRCGA